MDNWKTLSTKQIFKHRYLTLEEDSVVTPKGRKIKYLCLGRGVSSVTVVPILKDGKIPLIYQFRYPHKKYFWELPGGRIDDGEKPAEGAERELKEEMQIEADKFIKLGSFATAPGIDGHVKYVFLAEGAKFVNGPRKNDHDDSEFIQEVKTFTFPEILKMVEKGEIQVSATLIAILLYRDYLNRKKK